MDAKERLTELLIGKAEEKQVITIISRGVAEQLADKLISAGWQPPPEPQEDVIEAEAEVIYSKGDTAHLGSLVARTSDVRLHWRKVAVYVLRERCKAELAAVRERCKSRDTDCVGYGCTFHNSNPRRCGELQRQILAKYPKEVTEGIE